MSRTPPLVAVGHGSRDPRSAATITRLLDEVRVSAPWLDVRPAFLDLSAPRLGDVLDAVHADGHRQAVVVPLLLGTAYHATVDVPAAVREALQRHPRMRVQVADVLGPDPRLEAAAARRLAELGVDPDDDDLGVILAAAGSSHAPANAAVTAVTARWAGSVQWAGLSPAFAAAAEPDIGTAVRALRANGAGRIAVGSWFLAPGLLPDRIASGATAADPDVLLADPLGPAPEVVDVVLDRYADAAEAEGPLLRYA